LLTFLRLKLNPSRAEARIFDAHIHSYNENTFNANAVDCYGNKSSINFQKLFEETYTGIPENALLWMTFYPQLYSDPRALIWVNPMTQRYTKEFLRNAK